MPKTSQSTPKVESVWEGRTSWDPYRTWGNNKWSTGIFFLSSLRPLFPTSGAVYSWWFPQGRFLSCKKFYVGGLFRFCQFVGVIDSLDSWLVVRRACHPSGASPSFACEYDTRWYCLYLRHDAINMCIFQRSWRCCTDLLPGRRCHALLQNIVHMLATSQEILG